MLCSSSAVDSSCSWATVLVAASSCTQAALYSSISWPRRSCRFLSCSSRRVSSSMARCLAWVISVRRSRWRWLSALWSKISCCCWISSMALTGSDGASGYSVSSSAAWRFWAPIWPITVRRSYRALISRSRPVKASPTPMMFSRVSALSLSLACIKRGRSSASGSTKAFSSCWPLRWP